MTVIPNFDWNNYNLALSKMVKYKSIDVFKSFFFEILSFNGSSKAQHS